MLLPIKNSWRYFMPLIAIFLWMSCGQDKSESSKKETPKAATQTSMGVGTDTLPTDRQLQRYTAALESLERFRTEQKETMTPEIKKELEDKIQAFTNKRDSLKAIIAN